MNEKLFYSQSGLFSIVALIFITIIIIIILIPIPALAYWNPNSLQQTIWSINANGQKGELKINSVNTQGNITGTVFSNPIIGFFDGPLGKITFTRIINESDPSTFQVYTGYIFDNFCGHHCAYATLTGSFQTFSHSEDTTAEKAGVYGWYANTTIPVYPVLANNSVIT